MKVMTLIAVLAAGGAAFYFLGGPEKLGLVNRGGLPETIEVPNSTFMGDAESNPFAE